MFLDPFQAVKEKMSVSFAPLPRLGGVMVSSKDYNQKHLAPLISRDLAVASVARPCAVLVNLHAHPRGSRELTQALHFPLLWPLSMLGEKLSWRSLVE
ncbi:hypothetical protein SRHO_G00321550 [Serrasalmus rhombeus]